MPLLNRSDLGTNNELTGRLPPGEVLQSKNVIQQNHMAPGRSLEGLQEGGYSITSEESASEIELRKRISSLEQDLAATQHKFRHFQENTLIALRIFDRRQKLGYSIKTADKHTQTALQEQEPVAQDEEKKAEEKEEGEEDEKPSRRQRITRTRTRCENCRLRHKKCDEEGPICGACHRLGLECRYEANDHLLQSLERKQGAGETVGKEHSSSHGEHSHNSIASSRKDQSSYTSNVDAHQNIIVEAWVGQTEHRIPQLYNLSSADSHSCTPHTAALDEMPPNETRFEEALSPAPRKRHACPHCNHKAKSTSRLIRHQTRHTTEKPFKCKCGKEYKRKDSRDAHQRSCTYATPKRF